MSQKRAYRYRFYPTPDQVAILARTFGSARFVYNWALRRRTDASYLRQERISYAATSAALTALKGEPAIAWLNEVSSVPPQEALRQLDRAFRPFFAGRATSPTFNTSPTFKKKRGRQAAEYSTAAFHWEAEKRRLTLATMDAPLASVWSRACTGDPTTITVTQDPAGRYFVSFLVEEVPPLPAPTAGSELDRGAALVTLSTGEKITNPTHFPPPPREDGAQGVGAHPPRSPTNAVMVCTSSPPASAVKTKRCAWRRWRRPSRRRVGVRCSGRWRTRRTRRPGMGGFWSRLTRGIPVPSAARLAAISVLHPCFAPASCLTVGLPSVWCLA
jgi:hypothetical protein